MKSSSEEWQNSPCEEWRGFRNTFGNTNDYGRVWIDGIHWLAHRLAWTQTYGPIPEGMLICHHCDNPPCCNPKHLFMGTNADNMRDASKKGRLSNRLGIFRLEERHDEDANDLGNLE